MALTEPTRVRVGLYLRISSDDRRDELGVARQERNCRALADSKGWHVAEVYCDNDTSASKLDADGERPLARPAFSRLMADVRAHRLDILLVQNQDRISRLTDELEQVMRTLRKAGQRSFWTVSAGEVPIDSTNARLGYRVKGLFDAAYSEYISEKVREKKDELAEQGRPAGGGTRPFGYADDKVTMRLDEAALIREAAGRILAGDTLNGVVGDWNDRGVVTVTGKVWTANVLRGVLSSPRVAGLRSHRGEIVGDAMWPAILKRDQWEALGRIFAARRGRAPEVTNRRLLTGVLWCGRCGEPLWAGMNNGRQTYVCVKRAGRAGCFLSMEASQLEQLVVETVLRVMDKARIPITGPEGDHAGDVARLEGERDELAGMKARGELSMDEWKTLRAGVLERLEKATRLLSLDTEASARSEMIGRYMKPGALRRAWPDLDVNARREVLRALIDRVTISPALRGRNIFDPDRVTVAWRG